MAAGTSTASCGGTGAAEAGTANTANKGRATPAHITGSGFMAGQGATKSQKEEAQKRDTRSKDDNKDRKSTARTSPKGDDDKRAADDRKGSAKEKERVTSPKGERPRDSDRKSATQQGDRDTDQARSRDRVQLSEQKRSSLQQAFRKHRDLNRVTRVNFSINIGGRVPRDISLVVLPTYVVEIVPEYRGFRYFVVDDRMCIVHPRTYAIVEIITISGHERAERGGSSATLVLSEQEKMILLREVEWRRERTLALGALEVGVEIPRSVEVHTFSDRIVDMVPKVKGYRYFTLEDRLAIVPDGKVALVIDDRR
jgi:hypothetical protein